MNLLLSDYDPSIGTWKATMSDGPEVVGRYDGVRVMWTHGKDKGSGGDLPDIVYLPMREGRRSIYGEGVDVDDIPMDDWEFLTLMKSLKVEGETCEED
jgi:hypothetical protein